MVETKRKFVSVVISKSERDKKLARHKVNENWTIPDTSGSLSRWILWNKKSQSDSIKDYKKRFKLK